MRDMRLLRLFRDERPLCGHRMRYAREIIFGALTVCRDYGNFNFILFLLITSSLGCENVFFYVRRYGGREELFVGVFNQCQ